MIIFMTEKQFLKNKKKLVEPKEYIICDCTDDATGELTKFSNTMSLDGLKPPSGLVKLLSKGDLDEIDPKKIEKLEKKFYNGAEFRNTVLGLLMAFAKPGYDKNYFIVFKKKDYKICVKGVIKAIKRSIDIEDKIIFTFEDYEENKKILKKNLSSETRKALNASCNKLAKKLEQDFSDDDDVKKKKDKDKKNKKDKDKKKKKKKKDKYLSFLD